MDLSVFTTDGVQGQESDYVLLSFTRTKSISKFINEQRINVALTRAIKGLMIFGNLLVKYKELLKIENDRNKH